MKTSNKILLGLCIVVFAVPLLMSLTLRNKVRNNDFTVIKQDGPTREDRVRKGSISTFKVLRVTAPSSEFLSCHIKESNTAGFAYFPYSDNDSVAVENRGDTLDIRYLMIDRDGKKRQQWSGNNLRLDLKIPSANNVFIDGAEVVFDSMPSAVGEMTIRLLNRGVLANRTPLLKPLSIDSANTQPTSYLHSEKGGLMGMGDVLFASPEIAAMQQNMHALSGADFKELLIYHLL